MISHVNGHIILSSRMNLYTPLGIAEMLNRWFVALTEGEVKPKKDTWNGSSRKAPDTPAMEVKKEMKKAMAGGKKGEISMSAVGKYTFS